MRFLSLALDFTARSRATFRKPDAYGQVYCHVLHMWMVKVESHREFLEMPRESARMWEMQSRILVRAEFRACGQWHRSESAEFTHRPQSNEIGANSRIRRIRTEPSDIASSFGGQGGPHALEVRRQRFNLSEFDRVSLSRAAFVPDTRFPSSVGTSTFRTTSSAR